ncbi:ABC transporter substrate-binding protein [Conexibacter sp. W3-3-2]|uniref:ABC transporter substrate-binding protein n=1 Tax=Conexibacter sp. W3-3-2 TaxID=2675227 RepID=UPI0012B9BAE9|nr:ABC transporter substrate-binding protein [Conexibacter sp. W3-3-2]MTD44487.1 ABC transporter substrate-binding protein [Conexibacter sp. W3-3-2]
MRGSRTTRAVTALALVAALGVAGCGRDDDDGGGGGSAGAPGTTAGFDGKTIKLGVLTPLSGPVAVIGQPLTAGNQLWFDKLNAAGGVAGKYRVELVQRDTRYDPPTAVQAYNRLKDETAAFVQILGTPTISAVLPQIKRDGTVAGPATLDAEWVREPNLVPMGAPYQLQAINGIDYYLRTEGKGGGKKLCGMFQDDPYGEAGSQGVDFAMKELGQELAASVTFRQGDKDFTGQVTRLKNAGCDMVFLTALPTETGAILGTAAQGRFAPRWIAQSPAWVQALSQSPLKDYLEARLWVVAEGPAWGDESVPGMKELIAARKEFPSKAKVAEGDLYYAFGYNQARAMTAVLEQAVKNGDLSHEGILKAVQEVGTVSLDGLSGDYTYGPVAQRNPPRESSIFTVKADGPFGLEAAETNVASAPAKAFTFTGAAE